MRSYNFKKNKIIISTVKNPLIHKFLQKQNPINNIIYRNVINNKNKIYKYYIPTQIEQKRLFYDINDDNNNNKCFNRHSIKVNRIINKNTLEDINFLKMKMGIDLLTNKINMITDTVEFLNDSNKNHRHSKLRKNDSLDPLYFRDRILNKRNNKALNNNYIQKAKILNSNNNSKVNISSKSYNYFSPNSKRPKSMIKNNFHTHTNYKSKTKISDYFITDNDDDICGNYYLTDYKSLEPTKLEIIDDKTLKEYKYNSYHNLHKINNNNNLNTEYYKYSNSINNIHNAQKSKKNYFGLIKNDNERNSPDLNYYKITHKNNPYLVNQKLSNYFKKDKYNINDNTINNNINNNINNSIKNNKNNNNNMNKKQGKKDNEIYYGSFDQYFLDNQSSKGKDSNNIDETNNINIIYKNEENKNNYNIYNIINKDKIIQNNYYNTDNNLKIENRGRYSFYGSHKKDNEESDSMEIKESKKKYKESNLQRCSTSDLFLPHKKVIKNENIVTISNEKLKKNKEIKSKDDFYYDLLAEKIFEVRKNNNSYDELFKFSTIKNNFLNKFENNIRVNKLNKKSNIKKVRFFENDNHFIQFNQDEKVSKFIVFNYLGNKIYFKHCNIDKYYEKLKSKNENIKSILLNKEVNNSDNSEWNNLFEMINKIKSKNMSKENLKDSKNIKKNGFKIKNIESFRKKNDKNFKNIKNNEINNINNNKSKQINKKFTNTKVNKENKNKSLYNNIKNKVVNTFNKKSNFIDNKLKLKVK